MDVSQTDLQTAMPRLGFGVFQVRDQADATEAVINAIKVGYRLIDTAASYGNETAVGAGIKYAIQNGFVTREELFITTKLWVSDVAVDRAATAIDESINRLNLDYLDLLLIHQPYNDVFAAWRAMEAAQKAGKVRHIGVSNFDVAQITNLIEFNDVKPAVNQIEVNPFYQNKELVSFLQAEGIQVEAWAPFAEGRHHLFENAILKGIADNHNKSIGQVVLRWLVQQDIIPLAKSVRPTRMAENLNVLDFELTAQEMAKIQTLDTNVSQFFDHADPNQIRRIAAYQPVK